jgi:hypothetical protein
MGAWLVPQNIFLQLQTAINSSIMAQTRFFTIEVLLNRDYFFRGLKALSNNLLFVIGWQTTPVNGINDPSHD